MVDAQYERITAAIFDCLQQLAKMDGEGQGTEGKDQLNYHVILIGPYRRLGPALLLARSH